MLSKSIFGSLLTVLVTLGCGGRQTTSTGETPGAGGSAGEALLDGSAALPDGGAGTKNEVLCHLGDTALVGGETVHRDACNTCTCLWSGDVACTDKTCACVERDLKYDLGATFAASGNPGSLPQCLPTCGVSPHFAGDPIYSIDALPKGACDPYPYVDACVMSVRAPCACRVAPGPVTDYACRCVEGSWTCGIYTQGPYVCDDPCMSDAGVIPVDDGRPECALARQLTISSAGLSEEVRVGATIDIVISLTNRGPLDHGALPGVEVLLDSPYFEPAHFADDALFGLPAGEAATLHIPVKILALPAPCSPLVFHLRTLSLNTDRTCLGESFNLEVVVPLPNEANCPACPPKPGSGSCSPAGLSCRYPGDTPSCTCNKGQWECVVFLH